MSWVSYGNRRDFALRVSWVPHLEWLDQFDLPKAKSIEYQNVRGSILGLARLCMQGDRERWISYSRRPRWYTERQRYLYRGVTCQSVCVAIDELAKAGLVENWVAPAGSHQVLQSRFRGSPLLAKVSLPKVIEELVSRESIVFKRRSQDGGWILADYRDTNEIVRWRQNLREINEAIAATEISVVANGILDGRAFIETEKYGLIPRRRILHRVFNGDSKHGGRFYGAFWQRMRKEQRHIVYKTLTGIKRPLPNPNLQINGCCTIEHDFAELHPRLLYASLGLIPPVSNYEIEGWDRQLVKAAFNIMLNAGDRRGAIQAIADAQEIDHWATRDERTKIEHLIKEIERKHSQVTQARAFFSGAGLRLQRADSDLAEGILLSLLRNNIVALPVHDSFVVPVNFGERLAETMDAHLAELLEKMNRQYSIL